MKNIIIAFLSLIWVETFSQNSSEGYSFPPEWAPHEAVWLGWQPWENDSAFCKVQCEIAKAVRSYTKITLLFSSPAMQTSAFNLLYTYGVDTTKVRTYFVPIENIWVRDAGPRFLKNGSGQLAIAHAKWTLYGYPKELPSPDTIRGQINDSLATKMNLSQIKTDIVSEGGGLDFSSCCILGFKETAIQRNPGRSIEEIEKDLLRVFGKKKMIWLNKSPIADKITCGPKAENYFGWGANGHIDEYARFVNDSTILIAQIDSLQKNMDPVSRTDYDILKENLHILQQAYDETGKPFHIITMPSPTISLFARKSVLTDKEKNSITGKCIFRDFKIGDEIIWIPALSYLNYFVTNGVVLVPKYWQEGMPEEQQQKDEYVKQVYEKMFPDRKIIQINPLGANWRGGGMHCITQQQPKQ
jgi:agmatine deiminase